MIRPMDSQAVQAWRRARSVELQREVVSLAKAPRDAGHLAPLLPSFASLQGLYRRSQGGAAKVEPHLRQQGVLVAAARGAESESSLVASLQGEIGAAAALISISSAFLPAARLASPAEYPAAADVATSPRAVRQPPSRPQLVQLKRQRVAAPPNLLESLGLEPSKQPLPLPLQHSVGAVLEATSR